MYGGMSCCTYYNCFNLPFPINFVLPLDESKRIIDMPNGPQFIACFFTICMCSLRHYSAICLKCSETVSLNNTVYHIPRCYRGDDGIETDGIVYLDSYHVIIKYLYVLLPQLLCIRANYNDSEIVNLLKNDKRFVKKAAAYSGDPIMQSIADIVLKQSVFCPICGLYYDCFPAILQFISHTKKCIAATFS